MSELVGDLTILVPMLNEASTLQRLARNLAALEPPPAAILCVDGGSTDGSPAIARGLGWRVIEHSAPGRAAQINRGVAAAGPARVWILHADTLGADHPGGALARALDEPRTVLGGFIALLAGPETTRWGTSLHNWIKFWYVPLLFRPHLFLRGARLLFGDQAMFFRRADFLAVGGCDASLPVLEEADLCARLCRRGRIRMLNRVVITSDRRVALLGGLGANLAYLSVGTRWAFGQRRGLAERYPQVR